MPNWRCPCRWIYLPVDFRIRDCRSTTSAQPRCPNTCPLAAPSNYQTHDLKAMLLLVVCTGSDCIRGKCHGSHVWAPPIYFMIDWRKWNGTSTKLHSSSVIVGASYQCLAPQHLQIGYGTGQRCWHSLFTPQQQAFALTKPHALHAYSFLRLYRCLRALACLLAATLLCPRVGAGSRVLCFFPLLFRTLSVMRQCGYSILIGILSTTIGASEQAQSLWALRTQSTAQSFSKINAS